MRLVFLAHASATSASLLPTSHPDCIWVIEIFRRAEPHASRHMGRTVNAGVCVAAAFISAAPRNPIRGTHPACSPAPKAGCGSALRLALPRACLMQSPMHRALPCIRIRTLPKRPHANVCSSRVPREFARLTRGATPCRDLSNDQENRTTSSVWNDPSPYRLLHSCDSPPAPITRDRLAHDDLGTDSPHHHMVDSTNEHHDEQDPSDKIKLYLFKDK